ncbi:MAG TPA: adenylyltransferase/cytidyltransferase family protein [Ktedonobacterales bacterium]|jgi:D-beta-D-heptose 7-phosphate kinase/D-beta-D-heptose 1-phosphate adenosyltransferase
MQPSFAAPEPDDKMTIAPEQIAMPRDQLAALVAEEQAAGGRCVFTNGVFDLLHIGHIQLLWRARALGDLLIVGLNSDASTRRLKGAARPLIPQDERAELIASLAMVDYVTVFEEDTAGATIAALRPAVYVKGGDYATANAAERARDYLVGPDDLRRLVAGDPPADGALAALGGLVERLPEAPVVAGYSGSLALLAYLPGHSTTELIQRIISRYSPA